MPTLTRADVHINRPLGNIAVATIQDFTDFIADKVFPVVPVQKQSDLYFIYNRDYWFKSGATKRAPATESAGGGWHLDTGKYFCEKWAYHVDVDDDTRANADDPIDVDRDATEFVMQNIWLRREKQFNAQYLAPATWGGLVTTNSAGLLAPEDFTPSVAWDNANSNPVADIAKLKTEIRRNTSIRVNKMIVSYDINESLKQHPLIISRLTVDNLRVVTEDLLARLFGVDQYLVASAVENEAQEGQVGAYSFLTANKFLLCYAPPAPGILKPSAGYIFSWAGRNGNSAFGTRMKTIRMEEIEADRIEGEACFDMHQVSQELGILGTNLISAA